MVLFDHTQITDENSNNIGQSRREIYGDLVHGSSLRFVASDLAYQQIVRVGSQQNQMSYNSLMMPYIYLGVGKTSNYFLSLTVGLSINGEAKIYANTPIIPKS